MTAGLTYEGTAQILINFGVVHLYKTLQDSLMLVHAPSQESKMYIY
jgi:hypothetical protein